VVLLLGLLSPAPPLPRPGAPGLAGAAQAQPAARSPSGPFLDVRDFGAVPDGKTKNTAAIRRALAAAAARGGGTIYFGPGQYLTGPIHLKSHVTLFGDAGAVVKFSSDFDDYLPMVRMRWEGTEVTGFSPLIYGEKLENVSIRGRGTLDGQGEPWWKFFHALRAERKKTGVWPADSKWQREFFEKNKDLEWPEDPEPVQKMGFLRPPFIQLLDSKNIFIEGVTIRNSPFWTINPVYCDNVTVHGVTIENPDAAPNTDGINPESCRNVRISDCHINVGDDCITIKSGRDRQGRRIGRPAENYTITNCTMLHGHGGVVIGSEMSGGVKEITISNCVFDGTDRGIRMKSTRGRGGVVENVRVSNVVMKNIRDEAIVLDLHYTKTTPEPASERTPRFRNIHLSGVTAQAKIAGRLVGLPESPLENVTLTDMHLVAATGILIQEAKDISLRGIRVDAESGPAVTAERTAGLRLHDVGTGAPRGKTPVIDLVDARDVFLHGSVAGAGTEIFLRVGGKDSRGIRLAGNDLGAAKVPIATAKDVKAGTVVSRAP
jgi:hypothetical protein